MAKKYSDETIDSSEYPLEQKESAPKKEVKDFDISTEDYDKTSVKVEIVEYEVED